MADLDLACLAIVALAAVAGAVAGALAQLASAGGAVAGWLGARAFGPALVPVFQGRVPAFAAHAVASVVAFAACAIAAGLTLRLVGATLSRQGGAFGRVDRGLGALVGGAKAALVLWVMLSVLALWGRAVHLGPVHLDPRGSDLVAFAREHNALRRSSDPSPSPR